MIQQVDHLVSGSTDASGNFSSGTLRPVPTLWGALRVVAQTTGNAKWTITIGGIAKSFGTSDRIDVPILVQPGQGVQVQVKGALASIPVTGVLTGMGGDTLEEVRPFISLVPNVIGVTTSSPSSVMATTAGTLPGAQTTTPSVPGGTIAVGYEIVGTISNLQSITIVGVVTGRTYVNDTVLSDVPPAPVLIDPADTTLTCTVTPTGGLTPPAVDFIAWLVPVPVRPPLAGALWQAPIKIVQTSLAAVGTSSMLAGVAGQTVRLWGFGFLLGGGAATAARAFLEESTGGVSVGGFDSLAGEDSKEGGRNGAAIGASGAGLQLHVTVMPAGGTIFAWAAVSQG